MHFSFLLLNRTFLLRESVWVCNLEVMRNFHKINHNSLLTSRTRKREIHNYVTILLSYLTYFTCWVKCISYLSSVKSGNNQISISSFGKMSLLPLHPNCSGICGLANFCGFISIFRGFMGHFLKFLLPKTSVRS